MYKVNLSLIFVVYGLQIITLLSLNIHLEKAVSCSFLMQLVYYFQVQEGVDFLLFNLLVLRCLTDKTGHVWRRSDLDLYLVENMPLMKTTAKRVS